MKFLTILAVTLTASLAFAMPAVHDYSQFEVTVTQGSQTASGLYEIELTDYNSTQDTFSQKNTVTFQGHTQTSESWQPRTNFYSDSDIANIMTNCTSLGGASESMTVPAGTFSSCRVPFDDQDAKGTIWFGPVTFGIVKQDMTNNKNGQHMIFNLKAFRPGH